MHWPENAIIGYRCAVMNCPRYLHRRFWSAWHANWRHGFGNFM